MSRVATRSRVTRETSIDVRLDLDGTGRTKVSTGLPFFDHMVEQLGRHGGFDLELRADGDLHVDAHHTV
ncbi:MAG TPA: imidazoleglycerol-phosphate dehydratase, partial [Acidimicrobiales bacterium]|nr:imidazoleglycerol-phosphate dehydratase [Acidimicrobiales bacterium]